MKVGRGNFTFNTNTAVGVRTPTVLLLDLRTMDDSTMFTVNTVAANTLELQVLESNGCW